MASSKEVIRNDSLSTDRVNGMYDDDLILCPICTNILWKPIACKTCENSFCVNCIRLWLNEKPNQCPFNCRFQERKPPGILLKLLAKLNVDCENKSNGCEMIIPYEALDKHQVKECEYRLMRCPHCLQEMFFKDYQKHSDELCVSKRLTCLKCSTVYLQHEGHKERQCIEKQIATLVEVSQRPDLTLQSIKDNVNKMMQLQNKLLKNEEYAERSQLLTPSAPPEDLFPVPSAPIEEPPSPFRQSSTTETISAPAPVNLRLSSVDFTLVRRKNKVGDHVPNGYAGFNWENAYSIYKDYIKENSHLNGFTGAFSDSIQCVVYNGNGNPLTIYLPNAANQFGVHSFFASSIYHDEMRISVTGFRSNVPKITKQLVLSRGSPKLFQINFEEIDKITFTPMENSLYTMKKQTLCLVFINFVL